MKIIVRFFVPARSMAIWCFVFGVVAPLQAAEFSQPDANKFPNLFLWSDTCNVWVLRDSDAALLVGCGDGIVLDHLDEIGVRQVDWILLTDHHRENLQGAHRFDSSATSVAAPKHEAPFLETPTEFRKWSPKLGDPFSVYGASYVRPPQTPVKVHRWLAADDIIDWRGHQLKCLATPGHSPGGMSFLLRQGDASVVFSGGVIHDGARLTNWFDSEWDYGFAKGIDALSASVGILQETKPHLVCPSQGPFISNAEMQLASYRAKLTAFRAEYVRGYPVEGLAKRGRHPAVTPTAVPTLVQVTPHLYMFDETMAGKNFAIIISDTGHALVLDCGLFSEQALESLIVEMRRSLGLKEIDACWISHMHGDHFTLATALRERGVSLWTMDRIVDKCEHPERYDYPALITSYGEDLSGVKIDRILRDGEVIDWEGYQLHVNWMPGQTEFGNGLWLDLDGKRIVFTGDNLFGNPADLAQNGHECVVARNSAILEEGYQIAAQYLQKLKPDIIMGAHSILMTDPAAFVDRYQSWAKRMVEIFQDLLPDTDYAYLYDPFWVAAYPYRVDLTTEETQLVQVTIRNFREKPQSHRVMLQLPPGISADPIVLEGTVPPKERRTYPVQIKVQDRAALAEGIQIVPMDITLDGKRYGQLFDFICLGKVSAK